MRKKIQLKGNYHKLKNNYSNKKYLTINYEKNI